MTEECMEESYEEICGNNCFFLRLFIFETYVRGLIFSYDILSDLAHIISKVVAIPHIYYTRMHSCIQIYDDLN